MLKNLIKIIISLLIIFLILFFATWFSLPEFSQIKVDFNPLNQPSKNIYLDRNDSELYIDQIGKQIFVRLNDLPKYVIDDLIFFEDQSFWSNPGISIFGIIRGALSFGKVGGSTITQQLFRDIINWRDRIIFRKWVELVGAVKLTMTMSKKDILENYINSTAYFHTRDLTGLEIGSRYWFGKSASQLTRAQSIMLISMLNKKPASLQDLYSKYQLRINRLIEAGKLSQKDPYYEEILRGPEFKKSNIISKQSYSSFIDDVSEEIINKNRAQNYPNSGLTIHTTLDKLGNDFIFNLFSEFASKKEIKNISFLMFNSNQELIYNVKFPKSLKSDFDLSSSSAVMPASRAKVLCYASAIEVLINKGLSRNEILNYPLPTRYKYRKGKIVNDKYETKVVSLKKAVALSLNAPALFAANNITNPQSVCELASNYGIDWKPYESLPLGTQGTSEKNLLKAFYSILVNESKIKEPIILKEIKSSSGSQLYYAIDSNGSYNIVSKEAISILKECLQEVALNGTAIELNKSSLLKYWPIYLKTGTSNNGKHIAVSGAIGKYAFSLFVETKINIGSSIILIKLLQNILEQLAFNGFIANN